MLGKEYPLYVAGEAVTTGQWIDVLNKFSGERATRVAKATPDTIERAIAGAQSASEAMRRLPAHRRAEILRACVDAFQERDEELAQALCVEAGKPIGDSRGEVTRLIDTFRIAAEETVRFGGEWMPLDISPRAEGYQSITRRVPVGPASFISPFNFPLNLVAHKVAPAIAVGAPFVLKPSSRTPVGALIIGEILAGLDLPEGAFSILPASRGDSGPLTTDERLKALSFTGSAEVGWELKAKAGKKKVVLELGGNAGCIVDEGADLERAADRITFGAFYQSGQSCISVQRLYVHESHFDRMVELLVDRARALVAGDPLDESTSLGPIISEDEAERIENWVDEAVDHGAKLLCGGTRDGAFVEATWLTNVDPADKVSSAEVFGPVAVIEPFSEIREAIAGVNDSAYGLQAGIFTPRLDHAFHAWEELVVGGVVVNDIPSFRVDSMPYGGVKDSGHGREGIRWAMEDLSELRLLVLHKPGQLGG